MYPFVLLEFCTLCKEKRKKNEDNFSLRHRQFEQLEYIFMAGTPRRFNDTFFPVHIFLFLSLPVSISKGLGVAKEIQAIYNLWNTAHSNLALLRVLDSQFYSKKNILTIL